MIDTVVTRSTYTGNGSTNVYDYDYKIYDRGDLLVTVTDPDGLDTTLVIDTDFDVDGVGFVDGGSITLVDAGQDWIDEDGFLDNSYELLIRRVMDLTQETDVRNQAEYYPEMHEDQFDKLEMQIQQVEDVARRSIHAPETEDADDLILPTVADRAEKLLGFDEDGKPRSFTHAEIALGESGIITTDDLPEGDDNLYYTDARWQTAWALKSTTNLPEGSNLYYTTARFDTQLATKTTTDLTEGANLYYTAARFNTAFAAKTTTDLAEGINLYYTAARFNTAFSAKTTSDLTEGSNLYYTTARFDTAFGTKTTSNLAEGSNLYYTNARADARIAAANLADLNDVVITGITQDQVVTWDGANWVNADPSGGGGGGSSLKWEEYTNAPIKTMLYNYPLYEFEAGLAQQLYTVIKIPTSYNSDDDLYFSIKVVSQDNTGNIKFNVEAVLLGFDSNTTIDDATQTYTTNTAALTLSAGTIRLPQEIEFQLSISSQISSDALYPGDLVLVRLYRDTDTSTAVAYLMQGSEEVFYD